MFIISLPMFLMNQWVIESFGGGDIKLMFISGFLLGYVHILLAFCIAVIVGGLYAGIYLSVEKHIVIAICFWWFLIWESCFIVLWRIDFIFLFSLICFIQNRYYLFFI